MDDQASLSEQHGTFRLGTVLTVVLVIACVGYVVGVVFPWLGTSVYDQKAAVQMGIATSTPEVVIASSSLPVNVPVTHLATPVPLKAVYMSSWVAGTPRLRNKLVQLIDETELNAVVIDIKDYSGRITFTVHDPELAAYGSVENRIPDIVEFIRTLHEKGIYVIGRISVFQDAYMVLHKPEWAVRRASDKAVWKDHKGISWIDAGAEPYWQYVTAIAKESYAKGFDEFNFDYIRFPSDGDMKNIAYPWSGSTTRRVVIGKFFTYLQNSLLDVTSPEAGRAPMSADLFGYTTTNTDDLGIGQVLEVALPYFDYIAPMVYPSHYNSGFRNHAVPAAAPYDVVHYSLMRATERAIAASSSPQKIRPWLQDFSIGRTTYTPAMVKAQIKATYDNGLNGWMLWNASNNYTRAALDGAMSTSTVEREIEEEREEKATATSTPSVVG
jgi:hypothetical protein